MKRVSGKRGHKSVVYLSMRLILVVGLLLVSGCGKDEATPTPTQDTAPTSPQTTEGDEVLIVTGEFPPFTSESMQGRGLAVEIVEAVFAEMGRPVRVEFYPWARCETMVESGEAWGAIPYVPSPERREKYLISDTLFYGREMWFYYGDAMESVQYNELTDLLPYRIGVALGYWYIEPFTEAGLTLDEGPDEVANLRKLQAGRIDLFPVNEYVAAWLIQTNFPDDAASFGQLDTPLQVNDNVVIVSRTYPNSEDLLQEFDAAFARIQDNGVYQQISAKYLLEATSLEAAPAN